ncbi:MAG: hypothetical protein ACK2UK_10790 [Candidatus Promineifilaceae bacterium]|jgi:uncharacterized membrane protein YhaH (DUF805 family)
MNKSVARQDTMMMFFLILMILLVLVVGFLFHLSHGVIIALVTLLALLLAAVALWNKANKDADGSEWWQDDESDGWRGYF